MVSLPFIFRWRKHIFLMINQIFTEKHFSSSFWGADPLSIADSLLVSFLRGLYTDHPLVANKYTEII